MAILLNQAMQDCIDRCQTCESICLDTLSHSMALGGRHAEASHIQLLLACAEICNTSARFMLLRSPFHVNTCALCADVCGACADQCEQLVERDDEFMQRCADACRRCAESCREMARTVSLA